MDNEILNKREKKDSEELKKLEKSVEGIKDIWILVLKYLDKIETIPWISNLVKKFEIVVSLS